MAYVTGTASASAVPAKDFMVNVLHGNLTANGFTYVEEVVSSTVTARVYLSPSASNGLIDWYLIVMRASDGAGTVQFSVCELYNSTTHLAKAYIPVTGASVPNAADLYRVNDATGINLASGTGSYSRHLITITTTTFSYWLSINSGRVVIATRVGATDYQVYCGLADNILPTATLPSASVQLISTNLLENVSTSGPSQGGCTREPGQTASVAQNWTANIRSGYGNATLFGFVSPSVDVYTSRQYAASLAFFTARGTSTTPRGLLRGIVVFVPAGAVAGDTATLTDLSGTTKTYTCVGGASNPVWVDQAA